MIRIEFKRHRKPLVISSNISFLMQTQTKQMSIFQAPFPLDFEFELIANLLIAL